MPCLSITRLKLRHWWSVPGYLKATGTASKALQATPGYIDGYLGFSSGQVYWTVSLWTSRKVMEKYHASEAAQVTLARLPKWCGELSVAALDMPISEAPEPAEIARLLDKHGKIESVVRPTDAQARSIVWPDRRVPQMGMRIRPI
ncbi:hypothetical protein [Novosphingobium sp. 9]|uniref:hypothetical protein n=1 Tax=Novosphingobium sp. 9 TaxID=2025349 RepID=UPI0021B5F589|nr:hypothetical protein [Novosphingobium sp. 9]